MDCRQPVVNGSAMCHVVTPVTKNDPSVHLIHELTVLLSPVDIRGHVVVDARRHGSDGIGGVVGAEEVDGVVVVDHLW